MKIRIIFLTISVFSLYFIFSGITAQPETSYERLNYLAGKIKTECQKSDYKPQCYEDEILRIAKHIRMEDSFRLTEIVQKNDSSFAYCHVLAHKVSFLEAKRNPGNWRDIMNRCPAAMCNYGCLHGALIERFRGEVLSQSQIEEAVIEIKDVCEPRPGFNPTEIDRTMCYHALGHLGMYMTGGDPKVSTEICGKVSYKSDGRDYYETCIEGVYMTIFQGVDPEDIALVADIKPKKENVREFCSKFEGIDYEACNRESYPLFRDDLKDVGFIPGFCSYAKSDHGSWKCYATTLGDVAVEILEGRRSETYKSVCSRMPENKKEQCFANIATRLVQIDKNYLQQAVSICRDAEEEDSGEECYGDLMAYSTFTTEAGSSEHKNYCELFPGDWKDLCLNQK
jgi:hypothetical protein